MADWTPQDKEMALARLALGESPTTIAREMSIPKGTVKSWKHKMEKDAPPVEHSTEATKFSRKAWEIIHKGLTKLEKALEEAKNPKDIAIAVGILFDKVIKIVPTKPGAKTKRTDLRGVPTEHLRTLVEEMQETVVAVEDEVGKE